MRKTADLCKRLNVSRLILSSLFVIVSQMVYHVDYVNNNNDIINSIELITINNAFAQPLPKTNLPKEQTHIQALHRLTFIYSYEYFSNP
jgi:hypothetical protein